MKCKVCGREMVEDDLFKEGVVKMFFNFHQETRMICPVGCSVEYVNSSNKSKKEK